MSRRSSSTIFIRSFKSANVSKCGIFSSIAINLLGLFSNSILSGILHRMSRLDFLMNSLMPASVKSSSSSGLDNLRGAWTWRTFWYSKGI